MIFGPSTNLIEPLTPEERLDVNVFVREEALRRVQDNDYVRVELRDEVLALINDYCASLSSELWHHFSTNIHPVLLTMEWNDDLHLRYLEFRRLIDRQGLSGAGELVFTGLLDLLRQKQ